MTSLVEKLYTAPREQRAAILVFHDSAARDVIQQLAIGPRWDGDLNSKHGRDLLVDAGFAARWNGLNFLTDAGYAVVDTLWGLQRFVPS